VRQPRIFLIGIGAQKAGTTWLSFNLRKHPQVFVSPIKELHFWNSKFPVAAEQPAELRFAVKLARNMSRGEAGPGRLRRRRIRQRDLEERLGMGTDEKAYVDFFARRAAGLEVWAEITPSYSILDRTAYAAMAGILPGTRFLFVMRNPADRYWSQLRQAKQDRPHLNLAEAFSAGFGQAAYRLRSDYARTLQEILAVVPRQHLHAEFFERLFTADAMRKLCDFLTVDHAEPDFSPRLETEIKLAMSEEMRARAYKEFADVYRFVEEFCAGDLPPSWRADTLQYR
jgi:hypothetical protein